MTLTLATVALSLIAQAGPVPEPPRPVSPVSITVSAGGAKTWDDEGGIGTGASVGGGGEWRFRPKWSVGAEVERVAHERKTNYIDWSGQTIQASANVVYRFTARGVSPYVGGGFGGAFHSGDIVSRFSPTPMTKHVSSASTMEYGTLGVEIPMGDRFALSPDFRFTLCQGPDDAAPFSTMRFGVKVAIRF